MRYNKNINNKYCGQIKKLLGFNKKNTMCKYSQNTIF